MTTEKRIFLKIALAAGFLSSLAGANDVLHLAAHSSKPLHDVCLQLEEELHWRISYEDPPVLAGDELAPETNPGGVSHLVMRAQPLSIDVPTKNSTSSEVKRDAVRMLLDAYHRSGNRAVFRAIEQGDFIHIVPEAVRGEDGKLQRFQPMFDTHVTIPRGTYSLGVLTDQILSQVGQIRGIPVMQATVPLNLFAQATVTEEANDEPARDVLMRAFEGINEQRIADHLPVLRLTWNLGYNPNGNNYFFNVHSVALEQDDLRKNPPSQSKQQQPETKLPQPAGPSNGGKFSTKKPN
jgi:hypothetical protein